MRGSILSLAAACMLAALGACDLECSLIEPLRGISLAIELPAGQPQALDFALTVEPADAGEVVTYTFRCTNGSCSAVESSEIREVSIDYDRGNASRPDRLRTVLPSVDAMSVTLVVREGDAVTVERASPVSYESNQPNGPSCDGDDFPLAKVTFTLE